MQISEPSRLDAEDELRAFRDEFVIGNASLIYLDGNSLGRMPKRTSEVVANLLANQWSEGLVRSWGSWFDLPRRIGAKVARLIGAQPDEVVMADSTSVNLFKLSMAALEHRSPRRKIVTDDANFPSDLYVTSQLPARPELAIAKVDGAPFDAEARVGERLDETTALLSLSHTLFKSGYVYDMAALTEAAHDVGALALWDLSHSVGALPINVGAAGVDLAVGCSYKYISGGPGAPAFLYVRRELQERLRSPIAGWFGHRSAFDFSLEYEPGAGIDRFLAGTPAILSLACVEPAVDLLLEAGMDRVRAKSLRQTDYMISRIDETLTPLGFRLLTPRDHTHRGSHVAIAHPEAWRITQALIADANVVPDFRMPDVLRFGVTPLYTTFVEVDLAIERTREITASRRYETYSVSRSKVT